jgi:subtilisin-like proprotein convertase family protein
MAGAATVDILLSVDGGLTYTTTLASGVANDGSETIVAPNTPAPYCRIMVQPTGAPFFSVNTVDFAIDYLVAEVCTTYNSGTINLGIPDSTGANVQGPVVGHTINIPDNVLISDVNVYFDVTHTYTQDLILLINNVGNQDQVQVVARICGGESGIDATFDDEAGALVCGGTGNITTGVYQASNLLGVFNGQMSGGDWDMLAVDFYNGDTGQVNSYSIEICETVATALAVEDNSFTQFNVYPNPTNGVVNISLSTFEDVKVTLYDISGRHIYSDTLENNSNTFNKNIDLSNVASGVYLLNVKSGSKTATKKLVIQ